jgi:hypothetical protein
MWIVDEFNQTMSAADAGQSWKARCLRGKSASSAGAREKSNARIDPVDMATSIIAY